MLPVADHFFLGGRWYDALGCLDKVVISVLNSDRVKLRRIVLRL